jgi:AMP-binding enzyme
LRGQRPTGDTSALVKELRDWVGEQLGAIAKPDDIRFADNLPKTRSGKIMRRLLKAIARGEEITQDVSTLENPAIIEQLRGTEGAAAAPASPRKSAPAAGAARPRAASKPRRPAAAARAKARTATARKSAARKKSRAPARKSAVRRSPRPAPARRRRAASGRRRTPARR